MQDEKLVDKESLTNTKSGKQKLSQKSTGSQDTVATKPKEYLGTPPITYTIKKDKRFGFWSIYPSRGQNVIAELSGKYTMVEKAVADLKFHKPDSEYTIVRE